MCVWRRRVHIKGTNGDKARAEVTGLRRDSREAWRALPALLEETSPRRLALVS